MADAPWEESPFAWKIETQIDVDVPAPELDPLDTLIKDLIPHIRSEGEILETDLSPVTMSEWIPGIDPVGELLEDTILPPLPPAVTTLMRKYERGTETLPSGSGHVNIIVDLSYSMSAGIGRDSSDQDQTVATAAQALTRIAVNACRQGSHSFSVFAFGSGGGDGADGRVEGCATRQIWGSTLEEAKDYDGYLATLKKNGAGMVGDWNSMGGTNSGYAAMRLYNYMKDDVGSQIPDVTAATAFVLTDAYWSDISVNGLSADGSGNVNTQAIETNGPGGGGSDGFWYYAKKYHDDFGPFVLFKINAGSGSQSGLQEAYRKAYTQYVSGGRPNYGKCVFADYVKVDKNGGNLGEVAARMVDFINEMGGGGAGVPQCGGKGVTF
jgi:hypothetical protein